MIPKILLVDDREDNLISMEAILGTTHYRFEKANSGRQALKILLKEYDFALILMDVKMPGLNGFETAELIYERERLKNIPIIFITAHNYDEENIFKGYRAGAVDYIYKPVNPELLTAKVGVFVDLYQKNQKLILQEEKLIEINRSLKNEIKERKISEERIKALNLEQLKNIDRLEAANKELDRFAFMASHDLQEPLRKIRTFLSLLSNDPDNILDEKGKRYVERIQRASSHMQMLIKDIEAFSKISGQDNLVRCDLNKIVDEVLTEMDETITRKRAHVSVEKLPSLMVSPRLLYLLFSNLIGNALKYSKKDIPPIIKIYSDVGRNMSQVHSPQELMQFSRIFIEDNGIGFEQKYAEQIFSMFKRLHGEEYDGTGVGLALCKKIVEEHKGFISARSQVNVGSTFIVSLPAHNPSEVPNTVYFDAQKTLNN